MIDNQASFVSSFVKCGPPARAVSIYPQSSVANGYTSDFSRGTHRIYANWLVIYVYSSCMYTRVSVDDISEAIITNITSFVPALTK